MQHSSGGQGKWSGGRKRLICQTKEEAQEAVKDMLSGAALGTVEER